MICVSPRPGRYTSGFAAPSSPRGGARTPGSRPGRTPRSGSGRQSLTEIIV